MVSAHISILNQNICSAGCGFVVHHSDALGLIVIDRNTVAISAGDIRLSFGAHPAEISARVRFLHPLHNFAILSYNPADLPEEVGSSLFTSVWGV